MESPADSEPPADLLGVARANREEIVRLDGQARQLLWDSLPLLDAARRAEAAALVIRAEELMPRVAGLMEQNRRSLTAAIAAQRAKRTGGERAELNAEPDPAGR